MRGLLLALLLAVPAAAQSPLHDAVSDGDADRVAALLAGGADPDEAGGGALPLVAAAEVRSLPVFRALLDGGADADLYLDEWDDSSEGDFNDLLTSGELGAALDLLEAYPAFGFATHVVLPVAAARGDADAVARLLALGAEADLETRTRSSLGAHVMTPLLAGARPAAPLADLPDYDPARVARLLVEAGADPNAYASSGDEMFTPLHEAAENGRYEVVAELLALGADATLLTGVEMSARPPRTALQVAQDRLAEWQQKPAPWPPADLDFYLPTADELDAVIVLLQ